MHRTPVESSMVRSVGYDKVSRALEVEFTSGDIGHYLEVPSEEYIRMLNAPSIGKYLHQNIKPNFKFMKIKGGKK